MLSAGKQSGTIYCTDLTICMLSFVMLSIACAIKPFMLAAVMVSVLSVLTLSKAPAEVVFKPF